jgi:hypothetical protein
VELCDARRCLGRHQERRLVGHGHKLPVHAQRAAQEVDAIQRAAEAEAFTLTHPRTGSRDHKCPVPGGTGRRK